MVTALYQATLCGWAPKALPENVKHDDTIDIEITGIGTLSNPVVRNGQ
jgi:2-keto-4-pentenoate hydratase/2-oxohepta-3-ene-1,7-dioic acid hydratase in catechol pathway